MTSGRMPLFPAVGTSRDCLRMPLFDDCACRRPREECQCVRIQNPACPGEFADVELCVDCDGNLSVCVRRPNRPCAPCRKRRPRCDCPIW